MNSGLVIDTSIATITFIPERDHLFQFDSLLHSTRKIVLSGGEETSSVDCVIDHRTLNVTALELKRLFDW